MVVVAEGGRGGRCFGGGDNTENKEKDRNRKGNSTPPPTMMYVVTDTAMSGLVQGSPHRFLRKRHQTLRPGMTGRGRDQELRRIYRCLLTFCWRSELEKYVCR